MLFMPCVFMLCLLSRLWEWLVMPSLLRLVTLVMQVMDPASQKFNDKPFSMPSVEDAVR